MRARNRRTRNALPKAATRSSRDMLGKTPSVSATKPAMSPASSVQNEASPNRSVKLTIATPSRPRSSTALSWTAVRSSSPRGDGAEATRRFYAGAEAPPEDEGHGKDED